MAKIVIWIDLNAQSVCTYQFWIFMILWCSTGQGLSKDYKIEIFGYLVQQIRIKQANRRFIHNLKKVSDGTHKI
jgi:hypothetical protein